MQQFEIVLKNPKIQSYRFIALLLIFLNFSVFIFLLVADIHFFETAAAVFLVSIYCLYRFYMHKKYKTGFFIDEVSFFILAGSWIGIQNYIMALTSISLGVLYHLALQKLLFVFNADSIQKMNIPKAEYAWNQFSNVLLRDNILTLDFHNNKLIQAEIENGNRINEVVFNQFANAQINITGKNTLNKNFGEQ